MIQPGETYGHLKVLSYTGSGYWLCLCDCGKEKDIYSADLKYKRVFTCGCDAKRRSLPIGAGTRFGLLTAIIDNGKTIHCRCDCGKEKDIIRGNLLSGGTRSCGCMRGRKI